MSVAFIGALVGLLLGAALYGFNRALARRVELAETKRVLAVSGLIQLLFFPIAGWFAAPLLFGD